MALGHQDGVLLRWMVVKPAVLLLGNRRRRGHVRGVAPMEYRHACTVGNIRLVCGA